VLAADVSNCIAVAKFCISIHTPLILCAYPRLSMMLSILYASAYKGNMVLLALCREQHFCNDKKKMPTGRRLRLGSKLFGHHNMQLIAVLVGAHELTLTYMMHNCGTFMLSLGVTTD
jgi:hypothetical protein